MQEVIAGCGDARAVIRLAYELNYKGNIRELGS
jgi:hypothetical protein